MGPLPQPGRPDSRPQQHNSRQVAAVGSLHYPDDDDEGLHCWPPITSLVDLVDISVKLGIQFFSSGHLGPCPPPKSSPPTAASASPCAATHASGAPATCNRKAIVSNEWTCFNAGLRNLKLQKKGKISYQELHPQKLF